MARVNVRCWRETYRGLMPDAVLDDPGFVAARERFWTAALTDERYRDNRVAVAERDGELVGIAMSGPPLDAASGVGEAAVRALRAFSRPRHGCWAGAAGGGRRSGGVGWRCGSPTRTPAHRRSTASTASMPTGRPRSRAACGRSAWSAARSDLARCPYDRHRCEGRPPPLPPGQPGGLAVEAGRTVRVRHPPAPDAHRDQSAGPGQAPGQRRAGYFGAPFGRPFDEPLPWLDDEAEPNAECGPPPRSPARYRRPVPPGLGALGRHDRGAGAGRHRPVPWWPPTAAKSPCTGSWCTCSPRPTATPATPTSSANSSTAPSASRRARQHDAGRPGVVESYRNKLESAAKDAAG